MLSINEQFKRIIAEAVDDLATVDHDVVRACDGTDPLQHVVAGCEPTSLRIPSSEHPADGGKAVPAELITLWSTGHPGGIVSIAQASIQGFDISPNSDVQQ